MESFDTRSICALSSDAMDHTLRKPKKWLKNALRQAAGRPDIPKNARLLEKYGNRFQVPLRRLQQPRLRSIALVPHQNSRARSAQPGGLSTGAGSSRDGTDIVMEVRSHSEPATLTSVTHGGKVTVDATGSGTSTAVGNQSGVGTAGGGPVTASESSGSGISTAMVLESSSTTSQPRSSTTETTKQSTAAPITSVVAPVESLDESSGTNG